MYCISVITFFNDNLRFFVVTFQRINLDFFVFNGIDHSVFLIDSS